MTRESLFQVQKHCEWGSGRWGRKREESRGIRKMEPAFSQL